MHVINGYLDIQRDRSASEPMGLLHVRAIELTKDSPSGARTTSISLYAWQLSDLLQPFGLEMVENPKVAP